MESGPKKIESQESSFLTDLRETGEQGENFEKTLGSEALSVMEDYFKFKQEYPDLPDKNMLSSTSTLDAENSERNSIYLDIGNEYTLVVNGDAQLRIESPKHGGDDALLYEVDELGGTRNKLLGIDIDLKTGKFHPELKAQTVGRLQNIFRLARKYYDDLGETAGMAKFPQEEIHKWRTKRDRGLF